MTKKEVIDKLKELSVKFGTPRITQKEIRTVKGLEYHLRLHFPSGIAAAIKAAGLEPSPLAIKMGTSKDQLKEYILKLGKKLGKRPSVMDVRRDGKYSEVIFNKRFGKYGIQKAYKLAMNENKPKVENDNEVKPIKDFPNKPLFWGRAGETYVIAELMYRGYNSSLLPVDLGVDVMAIKDNDTYYFQVKNVSFEKVKSRTISITTSSFSKNQRSNMFYIFILQRQQIKDVLILPYQKIRELIKKQLIKFNKENKDFSICISKVGKIAKIHLPTDRSQSEDVSSYLNDWDVIV